MMTLTDRLDALAYLRTYLLEPDDRLAAAIKYSAMKNVWFTEATIRHRLDTIVRYYLDHTALLDWTSEYSIQSNRENPRSIGIIAAANIPLVVIHDVLSVFLSGHKAVIKLSDRDKYLLPFLIEVVSERYPDITDELFFVERLSGYDAVIATGSTNTSRYFHQYFSQVPKNIRANSTGIGVLTGKESQDDLSNLAQDMLMYFGLGCRNISMLLVPDGYDFTPLLEALHSHREIIRHSPFKNNYDYNKSLHILNGEDHLSSGSLMLVEQPNPSGQPSVCSFQYYESDEAVLTYISTQSDTIQLVAGMHSAATVAFGDTQLPRLTDYADGVDTMDFLQRLD